MNLNDFFLCPKRKNASELFGQNLGNLTIVCTRNRTRFSVMFSQNCMEMSASSALFFDKLKIFRQIATSIIFIFIENFESSSSDLFQYKF